MRAPAASRRCIEPVTWPAAPQKVSRTALKSQPPLSSCSKESITRVPQARQVVADLVELPIECRGEDRNVRVGIEHPTDSFGSRDETQEPEPLGASLLEGAD